MLDIPFLYPFVLCFIIGLYFLFFIVYLLLKGKSRILPDFFFLKNQQNAEPVNLLLLETKKFHTKPKHYT